MTSVQGHEPTSYETLKVIAGLLLKFTIVKMRGPNKNIEPQWLFTRAPTLVKKHQSGAP